MRWGASVGRTLGQFAVGAVVAAAAGLVLYACELLVVFGMVGSSDGPGGPWGAMMALTLVFEAVAVAVASGGTIVALAHGVHRDPRWSPTVLVGLAVGVMHWVPIIALEPLCGAFVAIDWTMHLGPWLGCVAAQIVTVNVLPRPCRVAVQEGMS